MTTPSITPIPLLPVSDVHQWREWFYQVSQLTGTHNSLVGLQGGNSSTGEYYHVTATEHSYLSNYTLPVQTITVGASPFTYQNTTNGNADVIINGGTVSLVNFSRDNSNFYTTATATNTILRLSPNDYVQVTYSAAPTMVLVPR